MRIRQELPYESRRGLYIQSGDEADDSDEFLALFPDPARAQVAAAILNGERPPFTGADLREQVLAAVDRFRERLSFTAPDLFPMRIAQLREEILGIFGDGW
jgi:hypothetical protein